MLAVVAPCVCGDRSEDELPVRLRDLQEFLREFTVAFRLTSVTLQVHCGLQVFDRLPHELTIGRNPRIRCGIGFFKSLLEFLLVLHCFRIGGLRVEPTHHLGESSHRSVLRPSVDIVLKDVGIPLLVEKLLVGLHWLAPLLNRVLVAVLSA